MRNLVLLLFLLGFSQIGRSQGDIPVDMKTGNPGVNIPMWTVTDDDLADNVMLYYDLSRLKLQQDANDWQGTAWSVTGGGSVIREVRGLPDDINETTGSDQRRGWLYLNGSGTRVSNDIGNFANSANSSIADCTDEIADNGKLNGFAYLQDTEPDIFYFQGPGLGGSFVFDNGTTPTIRLMPYQDITITYTTGSDSKLTSFTIKTNDGKTYTFNDISVNEKQAKNLVSSAVLKADYEFYKKKVVYNGSWGLTQVLSPFGAHIDYTYANQLVKTTNYVRVGIYNQSFDTPLSKIRLTTLYETRDSINRRHVSTITGSGGSKVSFNYTGSLFRGIKVYDLRKDGGTTVLKEFQLEYTTVANDISTRNYLKKVTELSGCDRMAPFQFTYINESRLPSIKFPAQDIWGYYNASDDGMHSFDEAENNYHLIPSLYVYPSEPPEHRVRLYPIPGYSGTEVILEGANRRPNESAMLLGTLNSVTYPNGGQMQLQYESNTYYDSRAAQNQIAGGLRIKRITYFDAINPSGVITNTYEYNDPTNGQSYGRLVEVPSFLIPVWQYKNPDYYTNSSYDIAYNSLLSVTEQWKRYTVRTETDLNSSTGTPVMYQNVIVKRQGNGSVKYQYLIPATYGSTTTGQWTPALDKFARNSGGSCIPMALIAGAESWVYPYSPNPNFHHERGLLERAYEYTEAGVLVRETYNEYQDIFRPGTTPSAPLKVWGVDYDLFGHSSAIFLYSKYYLLTDMNKVLLRTSVTTYDVAAAAKKQTEKVEYYYQSQPGAVHTLPVSIKNIRADGTIYTTTMKYPLDMGTINANSDQALLSLKDLQTTGRNSVPFEVVNYFQRTSSDTLRAMSANFIKYSTFSPGGTLPAEQYGLTATKPVTNFQNSGQSGSGPYSLMKDSNYELAATLSSYDARGHLKSSVGQGLIPATTVYGYSNTLPVAQISHVVASSGNAQFAFSDFETTTSDNEFTASNAFYGTGYTGASAVHPYATLTKTISKASNTSAYVVSFRAKTVSATPFSVRVTIKSTDLLTTYVSDTIKVLANTAFKFKRKSFSVASAPATFVITIVGEGLSAPSASSPSLLPVIDDVAFYPEQASLTSYTYQLPFGASSVTNHERGITMFNERDGLGRVRLTRDKDFNILQRNTYIQPVSFSLVAGISLPSPLYTTSSLTFTATDNPCVSGETYTWELRTYPGGTLVTSSSSASNTFNYTFSSAGSYRLNLTVSASGYPNQTASSDFAVTGQPYEGIFLCHKGVSVLGCSGSTVLSGCTGQSGASPSINAYFKVAYEDEVPSSPSFQWKKRNVGQTIWINVGTNSNEYNFKVFPNQASVEVMCTVTGSGGRTGNSSIKTVVVDTCT